MRTNVWKNKRALEAGWIPYGFPPPVIGEERIHAVTGPRGSGTSTVANQVARDLARRSGARVFRVDMRNVAGDHGAMVQLYRQVDSTFTGKGLSGQYLAVLFHRRLAAIGQPVVLWFDNVGNPCEIPALRSMFLEPTALPPDVRVVVSGEVDPTASRGVGRVVLEAPGPQKIRSVAEGLCREAFRVTPGPEVLENLTDAMSCNGRSLSRAARTLRDAGERAEARGAMRVELVDLSPLPREPGRRHGPEEVDREILGAVRALGRGQEVSVGALVRHLARPPSLVRRHLATLERKGLLVRRVRVGGMGGSRSLVSLPPGHPSSAR